MPFYDQPPSQQTEFHTPDEVVDVRWFRRQCEALLLSAIRDSEDDSPIIRSEARSYLVETGPQLGRAIYRLGGSHYQVAEFIAERQRIWADPTKLSPKLEFAILIFRARLNIANGCISVAGLARVLECPRMTLTEWLKYDRRPRRDQLQRVLPLLRDIYGGLYP